MRGVLPAALASALLAGPLAAGEPLRVAAGPAAAWSATVSEGVEARAGAAPSSGPRAVRLDFDFRGRSGWAGLRTAMAVELPENWELSFRIRGGGRPNTLEVKLVDPSGENVWWWRRKEAPFPGMWEGVVVKKRQVSFAWGPAGGGEPTRVGTLELVVTPGEGGKGSLEVDDVLLVERPVIAKAPGESKLTASSSAPDHPPAAAMDGRRETSWQSGASGQQELSVDFGAPREIGGIAVAWETEMAARDFIVDVSDDGKAWRTLRRVYGAAGEKSWLRLPETEARFLKLKLTDGDGPAFGIREIDVLPVAVAESPSALLAAMAGEARRGLFPRAFRGEQGYWTVVGVDGDRDNALLSEDGALEPGSGSFSVEPFVRVGGRLLTWADVKADAALEEGDLPIPTVRWTARDVSLEVTALGDGAPGASRILARYRLRNLTKGKLVATLALAIRPLLVNPPTQFLGAPSGAATIRTLEWDGGQVIVNGERTVVPLRRPASFSAAVSVAGDVTSYLEAGRVPPEGGAEDPFGLASGALAFPLALEAGRPADVVLDFPLFRGVPAAAAASTDGGEEFFSRRLEAVSASWREKLGRVGFSVPNEAKPLVALLRANLGFALVERSGAALRPGTRAYARSWIRDGALMAAALLRLGGAPAVRDYLVWYAPYQFESGRIPCCVDRRGADPVPEHDSHGEFLFLAGEYYRFTSDRPTLETLWPRIAKTVSAIDALRSQRRTPAYETPEKRRFYGLLPESISHEGYSARPVHSYWDDFWALRGLKDAVDLAEALGKGAEARRWAALRDEFRADLLASVARTMEEAKVDYVPGSADLADFDPTSTTVILDPADEAGGVPAAALARTWERYLDGFRARRDGKSSWDVYTPYELRNVGALLRLGRRDEAHEILAFFREGVRPNGWRGWAEVVGRDARTPRFLGDLPHAWVGTDFIRSFLDLFAFRADGDRSLVLGAGIPEAWLAGGAPVGVERLRTPFGELTFRMTSEGGAIRAEIGAGLRVPPGGLVLRPPGAPPKSATVNGREVPVDGSVVVVRDLPATVVIRR